MKKILTVFVLPIALLACQDATEPAVPTMDGAWEGSAVGWTLQLSTSESAGGDVSGERTHSVEGGSIPMTISGVHAHPDVSLTAQSAGFEDVVYSGSFEGSDVIVGSLSGAGFQTVSLTLERH